jgi:hypothetical protein
MTSRPSSAHRRAGRSWSTLAALVVGVPLAVGFLTLVERGFLQSSVLERYLQHEVEQVEVVLFCVALSALAVKLLGYWGERSACRRAVLPAWDGTPVGVGEAGGLQEGLSRLGRWLQNTYLVKRVVAVLDFVRSRGSAAELDDQIRTLADNDALAQENSFALVRFITWAIPILGFLGTVLGITGAISGVTPEKLEHDLSQVTDGLSLAFDATALALALTMITMFLSFLIDRAEQGVLQSVDRYVDEQLSHRFERTGAEGSELVELVRQNTQMLVRATEQVVQKQAEVWARTFAETERQRSEAGERQQKLLGAALEAMLERTLETHGKRLAALEKQMVDQSKDLLERMSAFASALKQSGQEHHESLARVVQSVTARTEALERLQDGEKQLVKLQEALAQNLAALAGAGSFEQAVQSLTAAVHMLTAKTVALPSGGTSRIGQRPGAAA